MRGGIEILGQQAFRLLQRASLNGASTPSVPASTIATQFNSPFLNLPQLLQQIQAIRLIALWGRVRDASQTGKLIIENASIHVNLVGSGTTLVRGYPAQVTHALVGAVGVDVYVAPNDWLYGSDFTELGAGVGPVSATQLQISLAADISNSDGAAAHNASFAIFVLYESYSLEVPRIARPRNGAAA